MGLGGVDDVVAAIEPMADQGFDQRRRMLAVGIHEQHGAEAGMIEAGEQRGLLAEIARQRDHLDVDRLRRQRQRRRERRIAAAVVHIDDLAGEPALGGEPGGDLADARMQGGQGPPPRYRRE